MVKIKATKLEVLEFFLKMKVVEAFQLKRRFGFTRHYAHNVLFRLKKQGLIINMTRGHYELTVKGLRRLKYYGKR